MTNDRIPVAPGEAVKAFREFLSVHPVGGLLTGFEKDEMALELARIALDFGKEPTQADALVAAARGRAKVLRDMLLVCTPWVQEAIGTDQERIEAIGASLEWPPSVLAEKLRRLVQDYDNALAHELREQAPI